MFDIEMNFYLLVYKTFFFNFLLTAHSLTLHKQTLCAQIKTFVPELQIKRRRKAQKGDHHR